MKQIQKGFTLIELMIVVAIIGILAAVAIPAYQDYVVKAKLAKVSSTVDSIKTAIALYYQENGSFPTTTTAATATYAAGGSATLGGATAAWTSLGLTTINLPPEVASVQYQSNANGDNYGLSIGFANIKATTINGQTVGLFPTQDAGNTVGLAGAITAVAASGVSPGMTSLPTYFVCSTNLDTVAKKYYNNSGTPCL